MRSFIFSYSHFSIHTYIRTYIHSFIQSFIHSLTHSLNGVHTLRMQTGKYENKGASIPVEERLCLVCKRNCREDEKHFFIDCTEYESLSGQLYFHISENDATFMHQFNRS